MRHTLFWLVLMSLPVTSMAAQATVDADTYQAVAYFTSGIVDGEAVDRIDSASLDQDYIVLYVDWDSLRVRAYRTEVRIIDPDGQLIGTISNTITPRHGRYSTYYYYRPNAGDTPGDWTYSLYVDGRSAFEAQIPVSAAE